MRTGAGHLTVAVVHLATDLRTYAEGRSTLHVDGETLGEVLAALDEMYPAVGRRVTDERGRLRRHVNVFIGPDRQVDPAARVSANDAVSILPAVSGG